jgi:hypothetical protein
MPRTKLATALAGQYEGVHFVSLPQVQHSTHRNTKIQNPNIKWGVGKEKKRGKKTVLKIE